MNLSLKYARGANNTISVCDKQNIYFGSITLNQFGMIDFKQDCVLSIVERHEVQVVCQRLQEVMR